ncbi:OTU protein [Dimargaris xerosporica]|nr:OTU protein [Dimargaris xerosporica]
MSSDSSPNSSVGAAAAETKDELLVRHRKESRDLVARTTALRKEARGNKKRKKELLQEIETLETELNERHAHELTQWESLATKEPATALDTGIEKAMDNLSFYRENLEDQVAKRVNKNKKQKERKAAKLAEMQEEAAHEASQQVNMEEVERKAMRALLKKHRLTLCEVKSDGHCLYRAIADQLTTYHDCAVDYQTLRSQAASYMRDHKDDFLPFLLNDAGDLMSDAVWGGQPEILALAQVHKLPMRIFQMGAPILTVAEEFQSDHPICLS